MDGFLDFLLFNNLYSRAKLYRAAQNDLTHEKNSVMDEEFGESWDDDFDEKFDDEDDEDDGLNIPSDLDDFDDF